MKIYSLTKRTLSFSEQYKQLCSVLKKSEQIYFERNFVNAPSDRRQARDGYNFIEGKSPRELGFAEGQALKDPIRDFNRILRFTGMIFRKQGFNYAKLKKLALNYEDAIPDRFCEQLHGIAEGSNLTFQEILLQNTVMDILYGHVFPKLSNQPLIQAPIHFEIGCTSLAIHNRNKGIQFGQNFDYLGIFKDALSFVHRKIGDRHIFSLHMGAIELPCGITSDNTALLVNSVKTNIVGDFETPIGIRTRQMFEECSTAQEMKNTFFQSPNSISCNLFFIDPKQIYRSETTPIISHTDEISSWAVSSNTFTHNDLQPYLFSPKYSKARQELAQKWVRFAPKKRFQILDFLQIAPFYRRGHLLESQTIAYLTNEKFGFGKPSDRQAIPF